MKKNVLVFGLISGVIVSTFMACSMAIYYKSENHNSAGSMIVGFASMAVAFSFIFVGVKNYRDKLNNGLISFGKAFLMGCLISFIASTLYVLTWAVEYNFFLTDFADKYEASQVASISKSNIPQQEIDAAIKDVKEQMVLYKTNPFYFAMFTYFEILPVGIFIALISALVLMRKDKKNKTPASA